MDMMNWTGLPVGQQGAEDGISRLKMARWQGCLLFLLFCVTCVLVRTRTTAVSSVSKGIECRYQSTATLYTEIVIGAVRINWPSIKPAATCVSVHAHFSPPLFSRLSPSCLLVPSSLILPPCSLSSETPTSITSFSCFRLSPYTSPLSLIQRETPPFTKGHRLFNPTRL
ncbi:hypothetical protein F5B17DRAFT_129944 [Nemania serpens]|nr:hypothetical protein F5B17DRAFT_129944 [Nemania serpens]